MTAVDHRTNGSRVNRDPTALRPKVATAVIPRFRQWFRRFTVGPGQIEPSTARPAHPQVPRCCHHRCIFCICEAVNAYYLDFSSRGRANAGLRRRTGAAHRRCCGAGGDRAQRVAPRRACRVDEAGARTTEARSGFYPRLSVSEAWQRGDEPVFVFGSLLSSRNFAASNSRSTH